MKRLSWLLLTFAFTWTLQAKTVHVATAGTLSEHIAEAEMYAIEELTISGELNGTDFKLLRDMAGNNYKGNQTSGKLKKLNIGAVSVVDGGELYFDSDRLEKANGYGSWWKTFSLNTIADELGAFIFAGTKLQEIVLPTSITKIGDWAFTYCTNLVSVIVPEGVVSIGEGVFMECEVIETATLPSTMQTIGRYAFSYCSNLIQTNIPEGVTVIDDNTYYRCNNLTDIKIPSSVKKISSQAFEQSGLTSIVIPQDVVSIEGHAFANCPLEVVTSYITNPRYLPASAFATDAFAEDEGFTSATLYVPYGKKSLYQQTDCWNLFQNIEEMEAPPFITFADPAAKEICVEHWDTDGDGELSYDEASAVTDLGEVFHYARITSFDEFQYFTGVTELQDQVFSSCFQLESIIIPKNVASIGEYAFWRGSLKNICVVAENPTFDSRGNCNAIIETATETLIVGCQNTVIPSGVKTIGNSAFENSELSELNLPHTVKRIGAFAFIGNEQLMSVSLPEGVEEVEMGAFALCTNVTSVSLPQTLKTVEIGAFENCNIKSILIPKGVEYVGPTAFSENGQLETIEVEAGNAVYDSRNGCNAIIETATNTLVQGCYTTVIPSTVTTIGLGAFDSCVALADIVIPDGVTSIGDFAFYRNESLSQITIPSAVTSIGGYAFSHCSSLSSVTVLATEPIKIGSSVFCIDSHTTGDQTTYTAPNATLYVPYGCGEAYAAAPGWKEFPCIVEMDDARNVQTLAMTTIPTMTYGDEAFILPTATSEGLPLTWTCSSDAVATVSGNLLSIVGAGIATITAIQAGNEGYRPLMQEFTLTIEKAPLIITADDQRVKLGNDLPPLTCTYDGFMLGETEAVLAHLPELTTTAHADSKRGTFPIIASGAEAQNYAISYVAGTMTIYPMNGDVNADDLVNVTDVADLISYLNGQNTEPDLYAADVNADGLATVADVVGVVLVIYGYDPVASAARAAAPLSASVDMEWLSEGGIAGISLRNSQALTAFQMDVTVPEGMIVADVRLSHDRSTGHVLTVVPIDQSHYRLLGYSPGNKTLQGDDGLLLTLCLEGQGKGDVFVSNIHVADTGAHDYLLSDATLGTANAIAAMAVSTAPFDILDMQGRLVKRQTTSLKGLRPGAYIINNKKVIIK